jgi:muconate cycloisomerase
VAELLGGVLRREVSLAHSFGIAMTPDDVAVEAEVVLADGVRALKLKVGADRVRDLAALAALRRLAPDAVIFVDANMAWRDAATAIEAIRRLDEHELAFVEQPVAWGEDLAAVRGSVRPPIMADESAWTARDVGELANARAVDYVSIYYSKPGGLRLAMAVAAACAEHALRANVNGSAESGIGSAANVHLAAATTTADLPSLIMASSPAGVAPTRQAARLYADDLIEEPLAYRDGHLVLSGSPGLGVRLDEAKLTKYRLDR